VSPSLQQTGVRAKGGLDFLWECYSATRVWRKNIGELKMKIWSSWETKKNKWVQD